MTGPEIRILVTGFGPFPGVPFNASAALVTHLAEAMPARIGGVSLHTAILPTDWRLASAEARALIRTVKPDAIVHFGVARRAKGFQVETRAFNSTRATPDHAGRMPHGRAVRPGGPPILAVTLPSERLVRSLRLARLPAVLSRDAGRYLCNAILYQSLVHAHAADNAPLVHRSKRRLQPEFGKIDAKQKARALMHERSECVSALVGFVHIPALPLVPADAAKPACGWPELKAGAETIIRALIPYLRDARRVGTKPHRPRSVVSSLA